jgi:hemerythrin-like domain-containing protein
MSKPAASPHPIPALPAMPDGMALLDACHQQTLLTLGKLAALIHHIDGQGSDAEARALAAEVVTFFDTTGRQHHEEEERHVFPRLLNSSDAVTVQAVQRLQQDHGWLEADWNEIGPQLDALAGGQGWVDLDVLREGVDIFVALSQEHMALEETLIYPAVRQSLLAPERLDMGREMLRQRRSRLRSTRR